MTPVRFAVLGTGKIARKVTPRIVAADGAVVVGAASRSAQRARAFADELGLEHAWAETEFAASPEFDAVYVTVPNHLHPAWAIELVRAGKHVLMEKPLAWTAADAERVFAEADKAGRVLVEAFAYPHTWAMRTVLERVGEIGPVRRVEGWFEIEIASGPTDNVRYSKAMAGGAMMDLGCYPMGFARYVAGEPDLGTVTAGAELVDLHEGSPEGDAVDGSSWASWTAQNGVEVRIACSMTRADRWGARIEGEHGAIEVGRVSMPTEVRIETANGSEHLVAPTPDGADEPDPAEMYTEQAAAFVRSVRDRAEPIPTPAWTIGQARLMERTLAAMGLALPPAPERPFGAG